MKILAYTFIGRSVLFLSFFFCITTGVKAQAIDTLRTYDFGKMPIAYETKKVYWERNYDSNGRLLFEGLKYAECFIGAFINYWGNGTIKTKGQYLPNKTNNWTDLHKRGLCSVMDGEWKNFDETGNLIKTVLYKQGKIVKEY